MRFTGGFLRLPCSSPGHSVSQDMQRRPLVLLCPSLLAFLILINSHKHRQPVSIVEAGAASILHSVSRGGNACSAHQCPTPVPSLFSKAKMRESWHSVSSAPRLFCNLEACNHENHDGETSWGKKGKLQQGAPLRHRSRRCFGSYYRSAGVGWAEKAGEGARVNGIQKRGKQHFSGRQPRTRTLSPCSLRDTSLLPSAYCARDSPFRSEPGEPPVPLSYVRISMGRVSSNDTSCFLPFSQLPHTSLRCPPSRYLDSTRSPDATPILRRQQQSFLPKHARCAAFHEPRLANSLSIFPAFHLASQQSQPSPTLTRLPGSSVSPCFLSIHDFRQHCEGSRSRLQLNGRRFAALSSYKTALLAHGRELEDTSDVEKKLTPLQIDYRKAFDLLEQADPTGVQAITAAYNAALHACERQQDRAGALGIYASMRENGIRVDAVTLHSLFALLEKFGDDTAILQILEELEAGESAGVLITPTLLALAISACCRGCNAPAAVRLMEQLKTLLRQNTDQFLANFRSAIPPDTADIAAAVAYPPATVYAQLVVVLTHAARYDEALRYYEEMKALQRRVLLRQRGLQRQMESRAEQLEREARRQGMGDSERQQMLHNLNTHMVEQQQTLLEDYQPSTIAINAALEACLCTGRLRQGLLIYQEDVRFAEQQMRLAGETLNQTEPPVSKAEPNLRTFELLLRLCGQQHQVPALEQIWRAFEQRRRNSVDTASHHTFSLPHAASCYSACITGFAQAGRWERALELLLNLHQETGKLQERHREQVSRMLAETNVRQTPVAEHQSSAFQQKKTETGEPRKRGPVEPDAGGYCDDRNANTKLEKVEERDVNLTEVGLVGPGESGVSVEPYLSVLLACKDAGEWRAALGVLRLLQQRHQQRLLLYNVEKAEESRLRGSRDKFEQKLLVLRKELAERQKKLRPEPTAGVHATPSDSRSKGTSPAGQRNLSVDTSEPPGVALLQCLDPPAVGRTPLPPEFPFAAFAAVAGACANARAWRQVLAVCAEFASPKWQSAVKSSDIASQGKVEEGKVFATAAAALHESEEDTGTQAPLEVQKEIQAYKLIALLRLGMEEAARQQCRVIRRLLLIQRQKDERREREYQRHLERIGSWEHDNRRKVEEPGGDWSRVPEGSEGKVWHGEGGDDDSKSGIAGVALRLAEQMLRPEELPPRSPSDVGRGLGLEEEVVSTRRCRDATPGMGYKQRPGYRPTCESVSPPPPASEYPPNVRAMSSMAPRHPGEAFASPTDGVGFQKAARCDHFSLAPSTVSDRLSASSSDPEQPDAPPRETVVEEKKDRNNTPVKCDTAVSRQECTRQFTEGEIHEHPRAGPVSGRDSFSSRGGTPMSLPRYQRTDENDSERLQLTKRHTEQFPSQSSHDPRGAEGVPEEQMAETTQVGMKEESSFTSVDSRRSRTALHTSRGMTELLARLEPAREQEARLLAEKLDITRRATEDSRVSREGKETPGRGYEAAENGVHFNNSEIRQYGRKHWDEVKLGVQAGEANEKGDGKTGLGEGKDRQTQNLLPYSHHIPKSGAPSSHRASLSPLVKTPLDSYSEEVMASDSSRRKQHFENQREMDDEITNRLAEGSPAAAALAGHDGLRTAAFLSSILGSPRTVLSHMTQEGVSVDE